MDIVGSKVDGVWYGGLLDRARKEEKREYYIGYKQALIDLHLRIYAYKKALKVTEDKRNRLVEEKHSGKKFTVPLLDDTSYNLEK